MLECNAGADHVTQASCIIFFQREIADLLCKMSTFVEHGADILVSCIFNRGLCTGFRPLGALLAGPMLFWQGVG